MVKKPKSDGVKAFVVDISSLEIEKWAGGFTPKTGQAIKAKAKLPVREILVDWLFHRGLDLTYSNGGLEARRVAELISDARGDKVTLNEDQYKRLKDATVSAPGLSYAEMPVIDRVLDAVEKTLAVG